MATKLRFMDGKLSYMFEFNQDARLIAAAFEDFGIGFGLTINCEEGSRPQFYDDEPSVWIR